MKLKYKFTIAALILFTCLSFYNCEGTRVHTSVGVGVDFGPHGPRVRPNVNVSLYNGGRY